MRHLRRKTKNGRQRVWLCTCSRHLPNSIIITTPSIITPASQIFIEYFCLQIPAQSPVTMSPRGRVHYSTPVATRKLDFQSFSLVIVRSEKSPVSLYKWRLKLRGFVQVFHPVIILCVCVIVRILYLSPRMIDLCSSTSLVVPKAYTV